MKSIKEEARLNCLDGFVYQNLTSDVCKHPISGCEMPYMVSS